MSEQTDKSYSLFKKGTAGCVFSTIAGGLFGLAALVAGLYYSLGKLEPNTLRWLATGSICLSPVLAIVSLLIGQLLYKSKVNGLRDGIETARDAWHEVSVGVGKVTQARQPAPRPQTFTTATPYPYPMGLPSGSGGMVIEQRTVSDEYYQQ